MSSEYEELIEYVNDIKDYNYHNGIKLTQIQENYAECRIDLTDSSFNAQGLVHGGLLFSICDDATGFAVSGNSRHCVTFSANINFLRDVKVGCKYIRATGIPIKTNDHTTTIEGSVYDDQDRLVAKGIYHYCFLN